MILPETVEHRRGDSVCVVVRQRRLVLVWNLLPMQRVEPWQQMDK
jgi:hypothetical protein